MNALFASFIRTYTATKCLRAWLTSLHTPFVSLFCYIFFSLLFAHDAFVFSFVSFYSAVFKADFNFRAQNCGRSQGHHSLFREEDEQPGKYFVFLFVQRLMAKRWYVPYTTCILDCRDQ